MAKLSRAQVDEDSDSGSSESQQFVVEVIKVARVKDGEWEYRVKWANYDSSEDTWEPEENLNNCSRLLKGFWEDVGMDDGDYYEGQEVKARPSWIKREKKKFANSTKKREPEEEDDYDEGPSMASSFAVKKESSRKGKAKQAISVPAKKRGRPPKIKSKKDHPPDDSEDELFSSTRIKSKKRNKAVLTSSDEEEQPLAERKQQKPSRPTITIPAQKQSTSVKRSRESPEESDSAGSLFSEKSEPSSPEVTLGSVVPRAQPATTASTVPMKRPSTDDDIASAPRKRQTLEMPMLITGTAGNATKARLAQRVPQASKPVSSAPALPSSLKRDLSGMKFKKITTAAAAQSPVQSNSPANPKPIPPLPRRSASASDHQSPAPPEQASPMLGTHAPAAAHPPAPTELRRAPPQLPRLHQMQSPVVDTMAEANKFLSQVMPPAMASPMRDEPISEMPPPLAPKRTTPIKVTLPRIQKKWKWIGDLFMDVSRKKAERLCEIVLSDASDPLPNGLRFNLCLTDDSDSIRLSAFHDLASLPMFLAASARVQQFAKAGPLEDKDADAFKQLGTYMKNRSLFCLDHLYHDALLIVYPTDHPLSTKVLQVPQTLAKDTPLQVALVPWELTSGAFHSADWKPKEPTVQRSLDSRFTPILDAAGKEVITQRRFYQAIHILGISREVFDYVSQIPRTYCFWTGPADAGNIGPGYETLLLKDFLSACKWTDLGLYSNARLVLVHVGGLASLHLLPGLAERRLQVGLRFMTYGTHPSVPHAQWGVREIYPLGGIVTFTPNAIIENHVRVFSLIRKIADHPTWECYVLPSVVAMVAKLTCQGQNPLRVYDEGQFVYEDLLRLIEEGTIALLQAPQATRTSLSKGDPSVLWTRWMLRLPAMNARQILEECITVAAEEFANASDADIGRAIEKEIARDLRRMHIQPAIMDSFRRFVAIKTKNDLNIQQDLRGFECHTLSNFEFKDDYYSPVDGKKPEPMADRKK